LVAAAVKESSFFLVAFVSLGGGMCSVARESSLIPVRWNCPYDLQQQQQQHKSSAAWGEKAVASRLLRRMCAPPSVLLHHAQQLLHPLAALPTAQWIETNSALKRRGGSGGSKLSLSLCLSLLLPSRDDACLFVCRSASDLLVCGRGVSVQAMVIWSAYGFFSNPFLLSLFLCVSRA